MKFFYFFLINDYFELLILLIISILLACFLIFFSYILIIQKPDSEKLSAYECGFEPYENTRNIFNIKFYLIALFFIIFDIEILFIIPWCVSLQSLNFLSFWALIDFFIELCIGFFYIWYSNSLDW